jgi:hypothetical protein
MSTRRHVFRYGVVAIRVCDLCQDEYAITRGLGFREPEPPPTRRYLGLDVCDDCCRELIRCGVTEPMPEVLDVV